jgi:hypothetical protein
MQRAFSAAFGGLRDHIVGSGSTMTTCGSPTVLAEGRSTRFEPNSMALRQQRDWPVADDAA